VILYDSNNRLVTDEFELFYDNLPIGFDGYRIALLADLHGAEHGANNERLVERVREARPDIIAIAGDLIDDYQPGNPVEQQIEISRTLVTQLVQIAPVYYVTGNHEWATGMIQDIFAMLEESGVTVLRNQYRTLSMGGDTIILAGVDDPNGPADMTTPRELVERIHASENPDFIVMLSHRNNNLRLYSDLDVDLVLSGHAHGGMYVYRSQMVLLDHKVSCFRHIQVVCTQGAVPIW